MWSWNKHASIQELKSNLTKAVAFVSIDLQLSVDGAEVGSLRLLWEALEEGALALEGLVGALATLETTIHGSIKSI